MPFFSFLSGLWGGHGPLGPPPWSRLWPKGSFTVLITLVSLVVTYRATISCSWFLYKPLTGSLELSVISYLICCIGFEFLYYTLAHMKMLWNSHSFFHSSMIHSSIPYLNANAGLEVWSWMDCCWTTAQGLYYGTYNFVDIACDKA